MREVNLHKINNNFVYRILSFIWRKTYIQYKENIKNKRYRKYWGEHFVSYGNQDEDKTFFIIRRREPYIGLFSFYITSIYQVAQALQNGYIPIIDLQNNENIYLDKNKIGKVNAWEYYFRQPCNYSLNDIQNSKNIIFGSGYVEEMFPYNDIGYLLDTNGEIKKWKAIAAKYFQLSDAAQQETEKVCASFLGEHILGVLCRGTDYTAAQPRGHHRQPTLEELFVKVDEVIVTYGCTKIFLGTEDVHIYNTFIKKYGNKVFTNRKQFIEYHGEKSIGKVVINKVQDKYEEGMDYLVTIAALARCDCFVGGHASGTVGVILMNKNFEYCYIFDLGLYS